MNIINKIKKKIGEKIKLSKRAIKYLLAGVLVAVVIGVSAGIILAGPDDKPVTGEAAALNTDAYLDFDSYNSNATINNVTKLFTGYVWSEDLGWVAFGTEDNPDGPVSVNPDSGALSGKALVLNTGGIIDFNNNPRNSNVRINSIGQFVGFAWSDDLGWLDFTYTANVDGLTLTNPEAPTGVLIYDVSNRDNADYAIVVRWQEPAGFDPSLFDTFIVERSIDGMVWVEMGTTVAYGYVDTNLTTGTTYRYRIKTRYITGTIDTSEVVSMDPTGKFTTPCGLVSGPSAVVGPTSLNVTWATDRECDSYVKIIENGTELTTQGLSEQVTEHTVSVIGLKPNTIYKYQILSTDVDGNILIGGEIDFTTTNSPSIYDLVASNITLDSAIINFKSTTISNFTLYYGKTTDYGTAIEEGASQETTNHSIALSNLESGTIYYYRLIGEDENGNELKSENSFSTLPLPEINNFKLEEVEDQPTTTLKITWTTNVETSSTVKYGNDAEFLEQASSDMVLEHEITITDMADASIYKIYAQGRDQFGNLAESEVVSFETPKDSRAPKLFDVTIETSNVGNKGDKAQVAVSWQTDEPATSHVEYGAGIDATDYTNKTSEDKSLTKEHLVIITDLEPGQPYHLRALSADEAGNVGQSTASAAVTGEVSKSALTIILEILQSIFGWMGKI